VYLDFLCLYYLLLFTLAACACLLMHRLCVPAFPHKTPYTTIAVQLGAGVAGAAHAAGQPAGYCDCLCLHDLLLFTLAANVCLLMHRLCVPARAFTNAQSSYVTTIFIRHHLMHHHRRAARCGSRRRCARCWSAAKSATAAQQATRSTIIMRPCHSWCCQCTTHRTTAATTTSSSSGGR
jgi:hypothetical protein